MHNVASGDLMAASGSQTCDVEADLCVPEACDLAAVQSDETCNSLAERLFGEATNVTLTQLTTWNPYLLGTCDRLLAPQFVCASPPGGAARIAEPAYNPTGTTGYYATATPLTPTPSGTIDECGIYHTVKAGEFCQAISLTYGITLDDFLQLNPELSLDCLNLWLGYSYCVYAVSRAPVSTDSSCGPSHSHATCVGSDFGDCCNMDGRCGSGSDYCDLANCQSGSCTLPISPDGSCGK
jgi:LysM repeat protein